MLALMVPAMLFGHASLASIGATFAFFAWAAVAAVWARIRGGDVVRGAVGDPFAMGLMMATPYLGAGLGGHGHGAGGASSTPGMMVLLALLVTVGWTALRAGAARADRPARIGFWACLLMFTGMLVAMGIGS